MFGTKTKRRFISAKSTEFFIAETFVYDYEPSYTAHWWFMDKYKHIALSKFAKFSWLVSVNLVSYKLQCKKIDFVIKI